MHTFTTTEHRCKFRLLLPPASRPRMKIQIEIEKGAKISWEAAARGSKFDWPAEPGGKKLALQPYLVLRKSKQTEHGRPEAGTAG